MNSSCAILHITGSPAAIDKHQGDLIRHALSVLYKTPRYAERGASDFRVVRRAPDYLAIRFCTQEGCVPAGLVRLNDVLIDDREVVDEVTFTAELASKLNISHIAPNPDRAVRFALLPDAPAVYITEPRFRVVFPIVQYLNADLKTGRYPRPFDSAAIDAEVGAEIVGQEVNAPDSLDDIGDISGLVDLD